jgi:hypothetical protein
MYIIGIIASARQTNEIKKEISKENFKCEVICINSKSIENIKNVKFEILIMQDSLEKLKENQKYVKEILKNTKYLLLNTDIIINEDIFKDASVKILTYGLKQKSTITASSIEEKQVVVSIQRAFKDLKGKIIEQQEVPVEPTKNSTKNLYNSLIKIAIINIFDVEKR